MSKFALLPKNSPMHNLPINQVLKYEELISSL